MNKKGFTLVETLLVVIILVIVGAVGAYVYHTQKTSPTTEAATTGKSNRKTPAQTYLAIKEWGVRLPLTGSLQGANYSYPQADNSDLVELYMPVDGKSQAATSCYGAVSIQRITASSYDSGTWDFYKDTADAGTKFWNVGDYYYMGSSGDIACGGSQTLYDQAQTASSALLQQAAQMQATE